jgi:hypothetical protein
MGWKTGLVMALALASLEAATAQALVLCAARQKGTDVIKNGAPLRLREVCKAKEIAVEADDISLGAPKVRALPVEFATALNGAVYELNGGGDLSGMVLGNAAFPRFAVGFTLPTDYVPGDDVVLRILWGNSRFNATSCGFAFWANGVSVFRENAPPSYPEGLFPNGQDLITLEAPDETEQIGQTTLTIAGQPGDTPVFQPGDVFSVLIARRPDDVPDTCTGKLFVLGAEMSYGGGG